MRLRPGHQLAYLLMVQLRIVATSSEELVVVRPVFDEEEGAHEQSLLEGGSWSRPSCKVWGDPHIQPFIGNYFDIQLPTSAAPTIPNGPDDKPYTLISSWTPGKWQTKIQVRAWPIAGIWSVRPDGVPCIRDACAPVARFPQILTACQHATNSMRRRDTQAAAIQHLNYDGNGRRLLQASFWNCGPPNPGAGIFDPVHCISKIVMRMGTNVVRTPTSPPLSKLIGRVNGQERYDLVDPVPGPLINGEEWHPTREEECAYIYISISVAIYCISI